jgi:hypothetical protein
MLYVRFTEKNEWEGETWHRFVKESDLTERLIKLIEDRKRESDDVGLSFKKGFTQEQVDAFTAIVSSECGYYTKYDVADINEEELKKKEGIDIDKLDPEDDCYWDDMEINYKLSMFK